MGTPRKPPSLSRLLSACHLPVYVVDARRTIVFVNSACAEWLQLAPDAILGQRCDYHSETPSPFDHLCPPPAALAGARATTPIVRPRLGEGATVDEVADALPLFDADGEPGLVLVAIRPRSASQSGDAACSVASADLHAWLQRFRRERSLPLAQLAGTSASIERVRAQVTLACESTANVVIVGPRGAGKRRLAESIHARRHAGGGGPLAVVDCEIGSAELLDAALESLAAGDRRPAEPLAASTELGAWPTKAPAPDGTLLLVHLERLAGPAAAALAARLEAGRAPSIIATTQIPPAELASRGRLSPSLVCRLATLEIALPPLAARREDLPLVIQCLVEGLNARRGTQLGGVSRELLARLTAADYPGELAQLEHMLREGHDRAAGPEITLDDLPQPSATPDARSAEASLAEPFQLDAFLRQIEEEAIRRALKRARGNKTKAAKLLGLSRPRLYRRMVQLSLIEAPEGWPLSVDEEPPLEPSDAGP